jgi:aminomethyltransferase
VWFSPDRALHLWDSLVETGRPYKLRAVGQTAMDISRIEAGLLLIDVDYTSARKTPWNIQKSSPFDLGLGWTVKLDKEHFVGRQALLEEKKKGSAWDTVGLVIDYDALESVYHSYGLPLEVPETSWGDDVPVYANGRHIGKATSGCWSPILKKYIAIARVKPEYAKLGTRIAMEVTVEAHREQAAVEVVSMPFYNPERKRK